MYSGGVREDSVRAVEQAMVAIRRLQARRTLARLGGAVDPVITGVVDVVEEHGEACTVSAVADALGVDQPRASRLVARAVEAGVVAREADQADGRRANLVLTAAGRDHADRVHSLRRTVFGEAMAGWSDRDAAAFARLLGEFVESYSDVTRVR